MQHPIYLRSRVCGRSTRLAREAALAGARRALGGRFAGRGVCSSCRHCLFAYHLAAYMEEATVPDGPSCLLKMWQARRLVAFRHCSVEQPSAFLRPSSKGGCGLCWDCPGLANVTLPLSLGGGRHANQTCRKAQQVAGAGAGRSTQARCRYRRTDG